MRSVLPGAVIAVLFGCGGAGRVADAVAVKGQVILPSGQPIKNVLLTLQPLDNGTMAGLKVKGDGTFSGDVIPGRYAYFFQAQESKFRTEQEKFDAAVKGVPEKYRTATMEHTVTVASSGGDLHIRLD